METETLFRKQFFHWLDCRACDGISQETRVNAVFSIPAEYLPYAITGPTVRAVTPAWVYQGCWASWQWTWTCMSPGPKWLPTSAQ